MTKSLVIVESPAKAKTISKYLGAEYIVKSSVGHIRDLPKGKSKNPAKRNVMPKDISAEEKEILKKINKRKADVKRWGIDPENSWKATYEISPGKEKVVKELRAAAKNVDHIYLAILVAWLPAFLSLLFHFAHRGELMAHFQNLLDP